MIRDSQRTAVYRWEDKLDFKFNLKRNISFREAHLIVEQIWHDYNLNGYSPWMSLPTLRRPPRKRNRRNASASGSGKVIILPDWALNTKTVIHETGHCMIFQIERAMHGWRVEPGHGKMFTALLLELYERYLGMDKVEARKMGIHQGHRRVRFHTKKVLHDFFFLRKQLPRMAASRLPDFEYERYLTKLKESNLEITYRI